MSTTRYDIFSSDISGQQLLYITQSQFSSDWNSTMHSHPCTELFFCLRGIGEFKVEDHSVPVGSDDLILVNANVSHTELSVATNPLEYIVLGLDGLTISFPHEGERYSILNCRDLRPEIEFYLRSILKEATEKRQGWQQICQHLVEVLLLLLSRKHSFSIKEPIRIQPNHECALVQRYIDQHFAETITLERLTEVSHISKYHLIHSFKKEFGVSPMRYVTTRRIRESKHLLKNTDLPLSQIAVITGFSSSSYFSQCFKKEEGIGPLEYRNQTKILCKGED